MSLLSRAAPHSLTLLLLSGIAFAADMRMWTDQHGKQVLAAFSERGGSGEIVRLRRADGALLDIPFTSLSTGDRAYTVRRSARDLRKSPSGYEPSAFVYRERTEKSTLYRVSRTVDAGRNVRIGFFASAGEQPGPVHSATYKFQVYSPPGALSFRPQNARRAILTMDGETHALGAMAYWGSTGHEWFSYTVAQDWFRRIAHADNVTLRIDRHEFVLTHEQREGMRVLLDHLELERKDKQDDAVPIPPPTLEIARELPAGLMHRSSRLLDVGSNVEIEFSASDGHYDMHVSSFFSQTRFVANNHADLFMDGKVLSREARKSHRAAGGKETYERLQYSFTPDLFERMAQARIVDLCIGNGVFTLTHEQREAMRVLLRHREAYGQERLALSDPAEERASGVFAFGTTGTELPEKHESRSETMVVGNNVRVSFSAAERARIAPFQLGSYFLNVDTSSAHAQFASGYSRKAEIEMDGMILDLRSPRAGSYVDRRQVHESLRFPFTPELFQRMAKAKDVTVRVGSYAFGLSFAQRKDMRDIVETMSP